VKAADNGSRPDFTQKAGRVRKVGLETNTGGVISGREVNVRRHGGEGKRWNTLQYLLLNNRRTTKLACMGGQQGIMGERLPRWRGDIWTVKLKGAKVYGKIHYQPREIPNGAITVSKTNKKLWIMGVKVYGGSSRTKIRPRADDGTGEGVPDQGQKH